MTSLSYIEAEAQRIVGRLPESRQREQQLALVELCESHWQLLRGPQPDTPIAEALWSTIPPLSDLFIDLYLQGDVRIDEIIHGSDLSKGLALIVLAELGRGNEAGVHLAHEPMMATEMSMPPVSWLERIAGLLHGTLEPPHAQAYDKHHDAMWKAMAVIAARTRRLDLPAMLEIIHLLIGSIKTSADASDVELNKLSDEVGDKGILFTGMDDEYVYFEQHTHGHKPVRTRRLGEILFEIRMVWLG